MSNPPTVMLSYSWDHEIHKAWVLGLATRLRSDGINTLLDVWHLTPGCRGPHFMESAVRESDFVLAICTPGYKDRSDHRKGGAGYEGHIITGELVVNLGTAKFIPVLREGEWASALPTWSAGISGIDLRDPERESEYRRLVIALYSPGDLAPQIGAKPDYVIQDLVAYPNVSGVPNRKSHTRAAVQPDAMGLAVAHSAIDAYQTLLEEFSQKIRVLGDLETLHLHLLTMLPIFRKQDQLLRHRELLKENSDRTLRIQSAVARGWVFLTPDAKQLLADLSRELSEYSKSTGDPTGMQIQTERQFFEFAWNELTAIAQRQIS